MTSTSIVPAGDINQALRDSLKGLATITKTDHERVRATAQTLMAAATSERLHVSHLIKAIDNYIAGKVEGETGQFWPAPGVLLIEARRIAASTGRTDDDMQAKLENNEHSASLKAALKHLRKVQHDKKLAEAKAQQIMGPYIQNAIKNILSARSIDDLQRAAQEQGISVPGCTFDIHGMSFPDGTRITVDELRARVKPTAASKKRWWDDKAELAASRDRIAKRMESGNV